MPKSFFVSLFLQSNRNTKNIFFVFMCVGLVEIVTKSEDDWLSSEGVISNSPCFAPPANNLPLRGL